MSSRFWLIVNSLSHGALMADRPHRLRQRAGWVSARGLTAAAQHRAVVELTPFTLHFPHFLSSNGRSTVAPKLGVGSLACDLQNLCPTLSDV
eukprot:5691560-Pleurochrysis_carterae.AAC.1